MFGTVSDMIAKASDAEILKAMDANSYKQQTKDLLVGNIRKSDEKLTVVKGNYGNGVSVKGILVNVSGFHFLKRLNLKKETGKSWKVKQLVEPVNSVDPLGTCLFFDAKSDGAAKGTRGGFTYRILDKESVIQGTISIAWENPYSGAFVYCAMVSKTQDLLQTCLNYCDKNSKNKISGDVTIKVGDDKLKQFISVNVMHDNQSTAYLVVGMKTDDMVKEVYGPL